MGRLHRFTLAAYAMLAGTSAIAGSASFDKDFAVIFIDSPYIPRRGTLAAGIRRIADAGARGLVLKFFFDRASTAEDDLKLAHAIALLPTVLQARLDNTELHPNQLPGRFALPLHATTAASGTSGWLPLPGFAAQAADVGFVDFDTGLVPMIETYRSQTVKSLTVSAIELAEGKRAVLIPGKCIAIGPHTFSLDNSNRSSAPDYSSAVLRSHSYTALMKGAVSPAALKNKVVILAYDGPSIQQFATPRGSIGAHRLFITILKAMYDKDQEGRCAP